MNSRRKGKRGELEAAAAIRSLFGTDARRNQQFCGNAGDADLSPESIPGYHVEVKNVAKVAAIAYHEQAKRDAKEGVPLVVMRGLRTPWYVLLTLEDFASLYNARKHDGDSETTAGTGDGTTEGTLDDRGEEPEHTRSDMGCR